MYLKALDYYRGNHVEISYEEAFKWFKRAASLGHVKAQNNLGVLHNKRQG